MILVKYNNNYWKCQRTWTEVPEKLYVIAYFHFQIWIVWPNYKNSPIFIEGQNKKFKFVFQCNLMISVDQLCSIFISSMVGMLAVEVDAFCHKSYLSPFGFHHFLWEVLLLVVCSRVLWFCNWHSGNNFSAQLNTVQSWYWRESKQIGLWTDTPLSVDLNFHVLVKCSF